MMAVSQGLTFNGKPVNQKIVQDYNAGIAYIMQAPDTCIRMTLDVSEFNDGCIPDNATASPVLNYGIAGNSVSAISYNYNSGGLAIYIVATADTCIPMAMEIVGSYRGVSTMQSYTYAD